MEPSLVSFGCGDFKWEFFGKQIQKENKIKTENILLLLLLLLHVNINEIVAALFFEIKISKHCGMRGTKEAESSLCKETLAY